MTLKRGQDNNYLISVLVHVPIIYLSEFGQDPFLLEIVCKKDIFQHSKALGDLENGSP